MANPTHITFGGVIDVSSDPTIITLTDISGDRRGSLFNSGDHRVYVGYQSDDVLTDDSSGADYGWVDSGGALRLPKRCSKMVLKTASSTSIVLYVED